MPRYELTLQAEFSAAHRLKMHDGRFEPLHGHNWRVEVYLVGDKLDECGLLADFVVLRRELQDILAGMHDTFLNELPAFSDRNPSTEHVAEYICVRFQSRLPRGVAVSKVRVWETSDGAAAYLP